ncbi:MAG: pectate lyase-like adhesive domain-containing protein [Acidimicrobiia bacterium]
MSDQSKGVRVRARVVAAVGAVVAAPLAILALGATAAGAVTVSNETEFRNAWGNAAETSIVLGADITLTCGGGGNALRNSAVPVVVDGGGTFSITQTCANSTNLGQAGAGQVTFRNVTISGGNRGVVSNAADVVLEHSTVTGIADSTVSAAYGVFSFGDITLDDSHVSDVTAAGDDAFGVISLGGGVSLVNGSTISEVHVTGNNGEAFGGASGSGGAVTLDHATITAIGGGTVGAGGFVAGGPAVVTDSRIAGVAGGGAAGLLATKGLTFTRSTIDGVTGGGTAAVGISLQTTEAATLTSSTVTDVTSVDDFAAGIFAGGPLETTDVLIHQIASTNDLAAGILGAGTAADVTLTRPR